MNQFSKIFSEESSWSLRRNQQTNFVDGVYGAGNSIFESIKNSINKYLEKTQDQSLISDYLKMRLTDTAIQLRMTSQRKRQYHCTGDSLVLWRESFWVYGIYLDQMRS